MISAVENFSKYFVWENRAAILPASMVIIPLAIEVISFSAALYKDPKIIQKKISLIKNEIHDAFHQRKNENSEEFQKRVIKKMAFVTCSILLIATAATVPLIILPTAFAIPAALAAIQVVALILSKLRELPDLLIKVKDYVKDAFTQHLGESDRNFHTRRNGAIIRIVLYTTLFAGAVGSVCLASHMAVSLAATSSIWTLHKMLPFQSPAVVIGEYVAIGILHALLAAKNLKEGQKSQAAFHAISALFSIIFPIGYQIQPVHGMRLHHSFIGLALQLAPWKPIQVFGSIISLDSLLYFFAPQRVANYDYMNIVVDNFSYVLTSLATMCMIERCLSYLVPLPVPLPLPLPENPTLSRSTQSNFNSKDARQ